MEPVVLADEVGKRYGDTQALDGVSITLYPGEIFTLIGPNGAGKTTFVRLVQGTLKPDTGSIRVFGHSPREHRHRIGSLPQSYDPPGRLTPREVIAYYARMYGALDQVDQIVQDVGLTEASDRWYETLSGGQQRRVCLGSALVNRPELLLLDEPTTGIDPRGRRQLWRLIRTLQEEEGTTTLLTTHDMQEAQLVSDRVGLLADGTLLAAGSPDRLIEEFGGKSQLTVILQQPQASIPLDEFEVPVERDGDELVFDGLLAQEIGTIIDRLEALGLEYRRINWTEPTLEDVYFSLLESHSSGTEAPKTTVERGASQ